MSILVFLFFLGLGGVVGIEGEFFGVSFFGGGVFGFGLIGVELFGVEVVFDVFLFLFIKLVMWLLYILF